MYILSSHCKFCGEINIWKCVLLKVTKKNNNLMKDAFSHYSSKVLVFTCSKRKAPIFTTFLFYFLYTKKII